MYDSDRWLSDRVTSLSCESNLFDQLRRYFARKGRAIFYSSSMQFQTDRRIFLQIMAAGAMAGPVMAAQRQAWDEIAPYFNPPKEWRGKLGKYRPALRFNDGSKVENPKDWACLLYTSDAADE